MGPQLFFFISWGFGFFRICLKCWNLELGYKKYQVLFFVNVILCNISSWNCYHQQEIYNLFKWLFYRCISDSCFFLKYFLHFWHCIALNIISTWKNHVALVVNVMCVVIVSRWNVTSENIYKKSLDVFWFHV